MPTINDLPQGILHYLAGTPEFSDYISADSVLDDLDAENYSPALELRMIAELSGCYYTIGTACFPPVYPLLLSYLWVLDNPYITRSREPEEIDSDIFLFLLHSRNFSGSAANLVHDAAGFCRQHKIPPEIAKKEIFEMLAVAYHPLSFCPASGAKGDTAPVYDADWLTNKLATAAKQANCPAEELLQKPLSSVLWWHIQAQKETAPPGTIRRRTKEEIAVAQAERLYELAVEFLKQKGKTI